MARLVVLMAGTTSPETARSRAERDGADAARAADGKRVRYAIWSSPLLGAAVWCGAGFAIRSVVLALFALPFVYF